MLCWQAAEVSLSASGTTATVQVRERQPHVRAVGRDADQRRLRSVWRRRSAVVAVAAGDASRHAVVHQLVLRGRTHAVQQLPGILRRQRTSSIDNKYWQRLQ